MNQTSVACRFVGGQPVAGRQTHGKATPPYGMSSSRQGPLPTALTPSGKRRGHRLPVPEACPLRRGLPPERPAFSHRTASLPARMACGAFRPRPLPCPPCMPAVRTAQSMLREVAAFWQQGRRKKDIKKGSLSSGQAPHVFALMAAVASFRTASSDGEAGAYGSSSRWRCRRGRSPCRSRPGHPRAARPGRRSGPLPCSRRSSA